MAAPDAYFRLRCKNVAYLNNAAVSFLMRGEDQYAAEACKAGLLLVHCCDHHLPSDLSQLKVTPNS
jgi:hypothetical protein